MINFSNFNKRIERLEQDILDFNNPEFTKTDKRKELLDYLYQLNKDSWGKLRASISKYNSLQIPENSFDEMSCWEWIYRSLSLFLTLKNMGFEILNYQKIEPVINYLLYYEKSIDLHNRPKQRSDFKDIFELLMNDLDIIGEFLTDYQYTILDLRHSENPKLKLKALDKTVGRITQQISYIPKLKEKYPNSFKLLFDIENILVTCKNQLLNKTLTPLMFSNLNFLDLKTLLITTPQINNSVHIEDSGIFLLFCVHYRVTNPCSYEQFKTMKEQLFLTIQRHLSQHTNTTAYDLWYHQTTTSLPKKAKVMGGYNTVTR